MRAPAQGPAEPRAETADSATAGPPPASQPAAAPSAYTSPTGGPRDEARLLVQSPRRLFFYWSFTRDPRPAVSAALGDVVARFRLAVRLVCAGGGWEGAPAAAPAEENGFWFDARPGTSYRAEVGFHSPGLPFVRLLSSDAVETPPAAASAESDAAPEFEIGERRFALLLETSGFPRAGRHVSSFGSPGGRARVESSSPPSSPRPTSPARRGGGDNF